MCGNVALWNDAQRNCSHNAQSPLAMTLKEKMIIWLKTAVKKDGDTVHEGDNVD